MRSGFATYRRQRRSCQLRQVLKRFLESVMLAQPKEQIQVPDGMSVGRQEGSTAMATTLGVF